MKDRRIILVGESNPYGSDPAYALYPLPAHATGGRLARVLGMAAGEYLGAFERVNLLKAGRWSAPAARSSADDLLRVIKFDDRLVLLGGRVSAAFGVGFRENLCAVDWFQVGTEVRRRRWILVLPHPSGRSRAWNDPALPARVRAAVEALRCAGCRDVRTAVPIPTVETPYISSVLGQESRHLPGELGTYDREELRRFTQLLGVEGRRRAGEDPAALDAEVRELYPNRLDGPLEGDPLCPTDECLGECAPEAHWL